MEGGLFQVSRLCQTHVFAAEPLRALHLVTVLKRGLFNDGTGTLAGLRSGGHR